MLNRADCRACCTTSEISKLFSPFPPLRYWPRLAVFRYGKDLGEANMMKARRFGRSRIKMIKGKERQGLVVISHTHLIKGV